MRRWLVLPCAFALLAFFVAGSVGAEIDFPKGMAGKRSVQGAGFDKQHGPFSQIECSVTATGPNTKLDCDDPFPNNEPQIGVNPVNPNHMIASSNDFGTCCDQFYTTFDGGAHWQTGNMSRENANKTGSDPVTVFDRKHGDGASFLPELLDAARERDSGLRRGRGRLDLARRRHDVGDTGSGRRPGSAAT